MHELVHETQKLHEKLKRTYETTYAHFVKVRDVDQAELTQGDRADLALLMREVGDMLDDLRKEAGANRELLDKVMCLIWTTEAEDSLLGKSIRGEIATATPDVRMAVNPPHPKRDRAKYELFANWAGLSAEFAESGLMRPHWPTLREMLSERMAQGKPLPPGIDASDTYAVYSTTLRRHNQQGSKGRRAGRLSCKTPNAQTLKRAT